MDYRQGGSRLSESRSRTTKACSSQPSSHQSSASVKEPRLSLGLDKSASLKKQPITPSRTPLRSLDVNTRSAVRTRSAKRSAAATEPSSLNDASAVTNLKFEESSDDFDPTFTPSRSSFSALAVKSHLPQYTPAHQNVSQPSSVLSMFSPASPPQQKVNRDVASFPELVYSPIIASHGRKHEDSHAVNEEPTSFTAAADTLLQQACTFRAEKEAAGGEQCLACDLFQHACGDMAGLVRRAEDECSAIRERYVRSHRAGQAALAQGEAWRNELHSVQDNHERLKVRYELLREQCSELEQSQQQALSDAARREEETATLRAERDAMVARVRALEAQLEQSREERFDDAATVLRNAGRESMVSDSRRRASTVARRERRSTRVGVSASDGAEEENELQMEVARLVVVNEMLQELSHTLQAEAVEKDAALEAAAGREQALQEHVRELEGVVAGLESELANKDKARAGVEEELAYVRADMHELQFQQRVEVKRLYDEINSVREEAVAELDTKRRLQEALYEAEERAHLLQEQVEEATSRAKDADALVFAAVADKEHAELSLRLVADAHEQAQEERAEVQTLLERAQAALQQSEAEVSSLRTELRAAHEAHALRLQQLERSYAHEDYRARYQSLLGENMELQEALQTALTVAEEADRAQTAWAESVETLAVRHAELEQEKNRIREQLEHARACVVASDTLAEKLREREAEVASLTTEAIAREASHAAALAALRAERDSSVGKQEERVAALQEELAELAAFTQEEKLCQAESVRALAAQVEALECALAEAGVAEEALRDDIQRLEALLSEQHSRARELAQEVELARAEREHMAVEMEFLQHRRDHASGDVQQLKQTSDALQKRVLELQDALDIAEVERLRLERVVQEQRRTLASAAAAGGALEDLDEDDFGTRTMSLTTHLSGLQAVRSEVDTVSAQRDQYRRQAAKLESRVAILQEELDRLQRRNKNPSSTDSELQALVSTLHAQLADAEHARTAVEEQLRATTKARVALAAEHAQCAVHSREQQSAIRSLEAQLRQLEAETADQCSHETREALERAIVELREVELVQAAQIEELQRAVAKHEQSVRELQAQGPSAGTSDEAQTIQTQAERIQELEGQAAYLKKYIMDYKADGDARIKAFSSELQSEKEVKKSLAKKLSKIKLVLLRNKHDIGSNPELQALLNALSA